MNLVPHPPGGPDTTRIRRCWIGWCERSWAKRPRAGHPVRVARGATAESDFDLIVVEVESFGDGRSRHAEEVHFHMASAKFEADADILVYSRDEADH